ncbi:MAG: GrdX family protein [Thermovirgaceae bacterium]
MNSKVFLTNNPLVRETFPAKAEYIETTTLSLLEKAMEYVLAGWQLVLGPLPPNVALIKSPYRTLVIERGKSEEVSAKDVMLLEKVIGKTRDLGTREISGESEKLHKDYAYMDLDHLRNALGEDCR